MTQKLTDRARMTRARKDVIRGILPDIVYQVAEIAKEIRLPKGLAQLVADEIYGYNAWQFDQRLQRLAANVESYQSTEYSEDLAALIVPELPGEWLKSDFDSALNAGGRPRDDEAGRQWLAFVYWLATKTEGLDKELDRAAVDHQRRAAMERGHRKD